MRRLLKVVLIVSLSASLMPLQAQRKGGDRGDRGNRSSEREFESVKGEFDAWKLAVLDSGILTLSEEGSDPAAQAGDFYQFLSSAALEERLSDEDFAKLGQDFIKLSLVAKEKGKGLGRG